MPRALARRGTNRHDRSRSSASRGLSQVSHELRDGAAGRLFHWSCRRTNDRETHIHQGCGRDSHAARRTSTASARIFGPIWGDRLSIVTASTRRSRRSSRSSAIETRLSNDFHPGSNSTKISTSLLGVASPRACDPNKASRRTPSCRNCGVREMTLAEMMLLESATRGS